MDYPFTMKYVVIIAVVILIVRIDYILRLFDRAADRINNPSSNQTAPEGFASRPIVPINDDPFLKASPKSLFFAALKDFSVSPSTVARNRVLELLKSHANLFGESLDENLAAVLSLLEEPLRNRNPEAAILLVELMDQLKGENILAARNTLAVFINADFVQFLKIYKTNKDATCAIATYQPENLPDQEKIYELTDRLDIVSKYLSSETADPQLKPMASNCKLRIEMKLTELKALIPAEPAEATEEAAALPSPVPETPAEETSQPSTPQGTSP